MSEETLASITGIFLCLKVNEWDIRLLRAKYRAEKIISGERTEYKKYTERMKNGMKI